jgi:hypothetical protein
MLAIRAFRLAPASILAPFQYLEILGATLLGAIIFDDLPDGWTGLGIAIVVGSGLYVFHHERRGDTALCKRKAGDLPEIDAETSTLGRPMMTRQALAKTSMRTSEPP